MNTVLCDITAFQAYRIPPCVASLIHEPIDLPTRQGRRALGDRKEYFGFLDVPLHVLVQDRAARHRADGIIQRLWCDELPPGAICDTGLSFKMTSPAFTLLLMANHLSKYQLVMVMYEMCGTFTVFKLDSHQRSLVEQYLATRPLMEADTWRPIRDGRGNITDLWSRPPLVTLDELYAMARASVGMRGHKAFMRALEEVRGIAASPLEVRAAMRLCGSRSFGGEGFGPVEMNHRVNLSQAARDVSSRLFAVVDLFFPATDRHGNVGVECQGRVAHGRGGVTDADANRLVALQLMGIDASLLTHEQLRDQARFHHVRKLLAKKLGRRYREKTPTFLAREAELMRDLFIDWSDLGRPHC